MDWKIALFSLAALPLIFIHPYFFSLRLRHLTAALIERCEELIAQIQERFSNIALIKVFGREDYELNRFKKKSAAKLETAIKAQKFSLLSSFAGTLLSRSVLGIIIIYTGYKVVRGVLPLGSFTAISLYLMQMITTQRNLANFINRIATETVSGERILEILDCRTDIETHGGRVAPGMLKQNIEFKNVTFGYQPDKKLFNQLNLLIPGGAKIALVGQSGCGKTTLVSLILKLYLPQAGEIRLGGEALKNLDSMSLRRQIGVALQQPLLWNDTVRYNIGYGDLKADFSSIVEAAKIAEAHQFIEALPRGYDTLVGEGGCKISEGQKQRLAIARAVIKRPEILILDEALASVDAACESKIIANLTSVLSPTTLIVISHRLSAILKLDEVYFLDPDGSVISGRHEALVAQSPAYREYLAEQLRAEKIPNVL